MNTYTCHTHTCTYVSFTHVCACSHTVVHECVYLCHVVMYAHAHACAHTHTHTHTMYAHYIYIHVHAHIHIHTHTHTHYALSLNKWFSTQYSDFALVQTYSVTSIKTKLIFCILCFFYGVGGRQLLPAG